MRPSRKHPFDKDQLEIVFHQLIEALNQLLAMSERDRNTPQHAVAVSEFIACREELNRQLDAAEARFG